jgi:hypothetical protein
MTIPPLALRLYARDRDGIFDEMSGFGYRAIDLEPSQWSRGEAEATYPHQTFFFTGPAGTVRGWYVTKKDGGAVQSCACSPVEIKSHGDKLRVAISLTIPALTRG